MSTKQLNQPWLWKRFTTNTIDSYTGGVDEPIIDLRNGAAKIRICDGVTPGGKVVGGEIVTGVAPPQITSHNGGETVTLQPLFQASPFHGITAALVADSQSSATWQVATVADFSVVERTEIVTAGDLTQWTPATNLPVGQIYVRVKYTGVSGTESAFSNVVADLTVPKPLPELEIAKLLASDGAGSDVYGWSVSISGDGTAALIGAYEDDHSGYNSPGSVYALKLENGSWVQKQKLIAGDASAGARFGSSVSISDDGATALIGAYGADTAYVFQLENGSWVEKQKLTGTGVASGDLYGAASAVSADGTVAVIGSRRSDASASNAGAAYIFALENGSWVQKQKLTASDAINGGGFGYATSVSADGSVILVGVERDEDLGSYAGAAYIFALENGSWVQKKKLRASDGAANDYFGRYVAISGDGATAIVGAASDDDHGSSSGSAYVFTLVGGNWTQKQKLTASDAAGAAYFGNSVSLSADGDVALIGARRSKVNIYDAGAAYVFQLENGSWVEKQKLVAGDAGDEDSFGWSVDLSSDGGSAVIGASYDTDNGTGSGSAYIFA